MRSLVIESCYDYDMLSGVLQLLRRQACKQTTQPWAKCGGDNGRCSDPDFCLFDLPVRVTQRSHLHWAVASCARALISLSWQFYAFLVCLPKVKCRLFTCCVAKKALFSSAISTNHLLPVVFSVGWVSRFSRCCGVLCLSTRRAICSLGHCPVPAHFVFWFC